MNFPKFTGCHISIDSLEAVYKRDDIWLVQNFWSANELVGYVVLF